MRQPPLIGNLTGKLVLHGFGDSPELTWSLSAQPSASGGSEAMAMVTAPGLMFRVRMEASTEVDLVKWWVVQGEVDLARWWRSLATRADVVGALPADMTLTGTAMVTGEGSLSGDLPTGMLAVRVVGAAIASRSQNWSSPGIDAEAKVTLTPAGMRLQMVQLQAASAEVAGFALRNMVLAAVGDASAQLLVQSARVDLLGGRIVLRPFTLDPANPEVATSAELEGVGLSDLAMLMPKALSEARGQLSGRVAVRWSASLGVQPGEGSLSVAPDAPATLRLAASPGFLTQRLPERITWLPSWLGFIAQKLAVENPAYDTLRRIELGELPLQVEKLAVKLYPDGPQGARSAAVTVEARPAAGSLVEKVTFDVNVAGPLDQVLRLGTDERVKMKVGSKP